MRWVFLSIFLLVGLCNLEISAQTQSRWIGGDGNWSDSNNWDNGVPAGFAVAIIEEGAGQITQDVSDLSVVGVELDSSTANIILQNEILIAQSLTWNDGKLSGPAEITLMGSGEINGGQLETTFDNFGVVEFGTDGEFTRLESPAGGAWNNRSGSTIFVNSGLLIGSFAAGSGVLNIEPNSVFVAAGNTLQSAWLFNNSGTLELRNFGFFFGGYEQTANAQLVLNGGSADFFQTTELDGLITGSGSIGNIDGTFDVAFEPGGRQLGQINSAGGILMTPQTVSTFQIGADFESDLLTNIGGPLQLDGTLNIEALPGATAGSYTLFSYNNAFMLQVDEIEFGDLPAGFEGFLMLQPQLQRIDLVVEAIDPVILGDANQDGSVNLLDVQPFVQLLASGGYLAQADINGDGELNLLDIQGFVDLLGAG